MLALSNDTMFEIHQQFAEEFNSFANYVIHSKVSRGNFVSGVTS